MKRTFLLALVAALGLVSIAHAQPGQPQIGVGTAGPSSVSFPVTWGPSTGPYRWTTGFNDASFNTSGSLPGSSLTLIMPYDQNGQASSFFFCVTDVNNFQTCNSSTVPGATRTATVTFTNNANNEDGFTLQRCQGVGCVFTIDLVHLTQSPGVGATVTYVDTSSPLPTACYQARATLAGVGDSGESNTGCFTGTIPKPPTAPTNFQLN